MALSCQRARSSETETWWDVASSSVRNCSSFMGSSLDSTSASAVARCSEAWLATAAGLLFGLAR